LPVLAAALLAGPGAARAQSVSDEASFRAIQPEALIPLGQPDWLTLRVDERAGFDGVSQIDPVTDSSINPGAVNQLDAGFEVTPNPRAAVGVRLSYAYTWVDYAEHPAFRTERHVLGGRLAGKALGGQWTLAASGEIWREGGQHLLDSWGGEASYAHPLAGTVSMVADYRYQRTAYAFARADSDLHQGSVLLVSPVGRAGSYLAGGLSLSRQAARADQLYVGLDPATGNPVIDLAYRPYDYWAEGAFATLRLRDVAGQPLLTGGADLAYQRLRYSHVDYAIDPAAGALRHDDMLQASAFVQYRLSRHLYARMTVQHQDDWSNLAAVDRHGAGATLGLRWRWAQ
jgi:hypothetical protein